MTTATIRDTCEARVGFYPGEFAEMPLWCSASVGLTTWTDTDGRTRRACRHHLARMLHRFPETAQSRTMCGKCNHPMHWHECAAYVSSVEPICLCRNDESYVSEIADDPLGQAKAEAIR
jgi:hypothetical protein